MYVVKWNHSSRVLFLSFYTLHVHCQVMPLALALALSTIVRVYINILLRHWNKETEKFQSTFIDWGSGKSYIVKISIIYEYVKVPSRLTLLNLFTDFLHLHFPGFTPVQFKHLKTNQSGDLFPVTSITFSSMNIHWNVFKSFSNSVLLLQYNTLPHPVSGTAFKWKSRKDK